MFGYPFVLLDTDDDYTEISETTGGRVRVLSLDAPITRVIDLDADVARIMALGGEVA